MWHLTGMPADVIQDIALLEFAVGPDGTVNVPHIGMVKAAGLNATELAASIEVHFMVGKIFTHPRVIIDPVQSRRYVWVGGGVRQPQRVIWSEDMNLSSAIGNAGGISFRSPRKVTLMREGKEISIDFRDVEKNPSRDPKLFPGDHVIVPE